VPRLDRERAVAIEDDRTSDLLIQSEDVPGVELLIPQASLVIFPPGSRREILLVPIAPDRLSTTPPSGRASVQPFQVEPLEVVFSPPAPVRFQNVDGLTPCAALDVFLLSPETGQWELVNQAVVDASGTLVDGADLPRGGL
jgi:hypothetical protein